MTDINKIAKKLREGKIVISKDMMHIIDLRAKDLARRYEALAKITDMLNKNAKTPCQQ